MQSISRREKTLLALGAFVLIIAAYLLLYPASGPAGSHKLLTLDEADSKYHERRTTLQQIVAQQDSLDRAASRLTYDRPAEEIAPQVVRDLQRIAQKAGVHLREVRPQRAHLLESGQGAALPIEVRFRAEFQPDVVRFLYYLEDPAQKLGVDRLDITPADAGSRAGAGLKTVEVSARVTVYTRSLTGGTEGESTDVSESSGQG